MNVMKSVLWVFAFFTLLGTSQLIAQENKQLAAVQNKSFIGCGLDPITGTKTASLQVPGVYKGKFFYEKEKAPVKEKHSWLLYLENGKGEIMEGAQIYVDGINEEAGRGFASPPTISEYLGNGHYRVDGIYFSQAGIWTMRFQVIWDGIADVLSYEVEI